MKIRAAVLNAIGAKAPYVDSKPLTIEDVELAPPGHGEVLVRIGAAGLCHSDLSVINGDRPRPMPMALGHEAAGVVEQLGEGVTDLKRGDHVVLVFVPSCGHCGPCAEGRPALCEPGAAANGAGTLLSGERRLTRSGKPVNHHLGCSVFAEYATVSRRSVVKIDPELPLDHAALFGCAVLTGVGAVVNTAQVRAGASVAVIGLGGVGLGVAIGRAGGRCPSDHRSRPVGCETRFGGVARCHAHLQCGQRGLPGTDPRIDVRGRRVRLRAGRIGARAGPRLQDHPSRRYYGDRRSAAADGDACLVRRSIWSPKNGRSRAATLEPACRRAIFRVTSNCIGRAACRSID